jgi:hypothetical protein
MNDVSVTLSSIGDLLTEAGRPDLSLAERAGIYAAVRVFAQDLHEYVDERMEGHGYANEKITKIQWHFGAALGFDVDNGHDARTHRGWVLGDLGVLSDVINQARHENAFG